MGNEAKGTAPERVRVVVRAGKSDWIGVAYADESNDPSAIHEYVRADLVTRLEQALRETVSFIESQDEFAKAIVEPRVLALARAALNDKERR